MRGWNRTQTSLMAQIDADFWEGNSLLDNRQVQIQIEFTLLDNRARIGQKIGQLRWFRQ